eukprot:g16669.t1
MVEAFIDFTLDKDNQLAGVHELAREGHFSEENLRTYAEDGTIPIAIFDALVPVTDKNITVANARVTHAHGIREPESSANNSTDDEEGDSDARDKQGSGAEDGDSDARVPPPFLVETSAVMQTGEHLAKSADFKPSHLRTLEATMKETDFFDWRLFAEAYPNLFPHAVGGHMDDRRREVSFNEWAQICLRQRDARFRESKTFLFCVCALIFRREAIKNARWKLTGRVSSRAAEMLASITPEDLAAAAKEMEEGSGAWSVLANRSAVRALIASMESVHSGASWTIHHKRFVRMIAISYIIQMGQPLWWLTVSPADVNTPIVLEMAGVKLDVTSRLKAAYPDYAKRLQLVAANHVASAFFYHAVTEAVLKCLLRFGAKDGDGGLLGRVKGYVGMTEEQRRLMLHCHLLVWVDGYTDFSSFRVLLDKTPEKCNELAHFLERVIFNQVASLADVNVALHGHSLGDVSHDPADTEAAVETLDPAIIDARRRIAESPPSGAIHIKFGYGDKGKALEAETTVVRGPCVFHINGNMTIDGVVYHPGDPSTAAGMQEAQAFQQVFDSCVSELASGNGTPTSERFTAVTRRLHTHINPYNPIIAFLIRSNMDLKVLLRDSDAKGILFYILNYATKTEQTLDVLLPLLLPVVERIRDDDEDEQSGDEDSSDDNGAIVTAVRGKLTVKQRAHAVYLHRCDPDDTERPLHGYSYYLWTRNVRVEKFDPRHPMATVRTSPQEEKHAEDDGEGGEPPGDDIDEPETASSRRGRRACVRYDCVGPFKNKLVQVMREKPAMLNLMRDVPRYDTQREAHCRLLLCLFVPFCGLDDLKT